MAPRLVELYEGFSGRQSHLVFAHARFSDLLQTHIFFDPGYVTIDATIFHGATGPYRLIFKEQTYDPLTFQERVATGPTLEGPWSNISGPINESWSEGPSAIRSAINTSSTTTTIARRAPVSRLWHHRLEATGRTSLRKRRCRRIRKHGSFLHITDGRSGPAACAP